MSRKVPRFRSDQQAIDYLEQDLSGLDFSQFKPVKIEIAEDVPIDLRIPQQLLDRLEQRAQAKGLAIDRYLRELMERDVGSAAP